MDALYRLAVFPITLAKVIWDYILAIVLVLLLVAAVAVGLALLPTVLPFLFAAFWLVLFLYVTIGVITMMYAPGTGDRTHDWSGARRFGTLVVIGLPLAWIVWWASPWISRGHAWLVGVAAKAVRPVAVYTADGVGWPPTTDVDSRADWLANHWRAFTEAPLGSWHVTYQPLVDLLPNDRPSLWVLLLPFVLWAMHRRIRRNDARLTRVEAPSP
jgi:hypothetical protein